jgi:hypothetical protein
MPSFQRIGTAPDVSCWPIAPIDNLASCPLLAEADMRLDKG